MGTLFFYIFAGIMLLGGIGVVICRNPVSSAFSMVGSFIGLAALFIMLNAYLVGVLQILVYAGAIMVLFLFIIMLLDLKVEGARRIKPTTVIGASVLVAAFFSQVALVIDQFPDSAKPMPPLAKAAANDVEQIGMLMFTNYNFPLQVIGVLLLVATIGVVVLSKKELK